MIIIVHQNNQVSQILDENFKSVSFPVNNSIAKVMLALAKQYPLELIVWCEKTYLGVVNFNAVPKIFHHNLIMASFAVSGVNYMPKDIGFVDQSVFLNINKKVSYPTWLMSSDIGGISAVFLNALTTITVFSDFNYFLNSLAKLAMPKGLFCYSEPKFVKSKPTYFIDNQVASNKELFKFVKQHYKWFWVIMLLFCKIIYLKRMPLWAFFKTTFVKKRVVGFSFLDIASTNKNIDKKEIDVIIPTIGRAKYLFDVLSDLKSQTLLPRRVIIVEQNPDTNSNSELSFVNNKDWPFIIEHIFTHQTGVCNARNLALNLVKSEWVFLNDDDNRFGNNLIEDVFKFIKKYGVSVLSVKYLQPGETLATFYNYTNQTGIFGSGNSFVKTSCLKDVKFNMALEFGYGEDFDFGVQLRNKGYDVVFTPDIAITHLKAPMGGFRTKVKQLWDNDVIKPKPSPTIMYTLLKHSTKEQILSYKVILFVKQLTKYRKINLLKFYNNFQKEWGVSVYWANKLDQDKLNVF